MQTFNVILAIGLLVLFGAVLNFLSMRQLRMRLNFVMDYHNAFVEHIEGVVHGTQQNDKYIWLTEKLNMMQRELGDNGIIAHFRDPLVGIQVSNYQLLPNFLPESRRYSNEFNNSITAERFNSCVDMCQQMFIRHGGDLQELMDARMKKAFNPFTCLAEAVRYILALPINILYWFGIIPERLLNWIKLSWLFKLINSIVLLVGLLSSIMGIALGWDNFVNLVKSFM